MPVEEIVFQQRTCQVLAFKDVAKDLDFCFRDGSALGAEDIPKSPRTLSEVILLLILAT